MKVLRILFHLMRADFLERIRSYSFLITVAVTVLTTYLFLPPNHGTYVTLQMGGHRGLYNSAWVGTIVAMMSTVFLWLAGFFLIKNGIWRDRVTGVGEIIAATPVRKSWYTLGKALSNFAVLAMMIGVLAVAAIGMQLIRGEDRSIALGSLIYPFLVVSIPTAAVIASAAVLFESVRGLRGIFGSVLWFALWIRSLISDGFGDWDLYGMSRTLISVKEGCANAFADYSVESGHSIGFNFREGGKTWDLTTFTWEGVPLTQGFLIQRLQLLAFAVVVATVAGVFFDRFRTSHFSHTAIGTRLQRGLLERLQRVGSRWSRRGRAASATPEGASSSIRVDSLTRLAGAASIQQRTGATWAGILRAEWRLLLHQHGSLWWVVELGLILASLFSPLEVARHFLWPAAWFWPILLWSSLGTRETRYRMEPIVFSTPFPLLRQLTATWLAAVALMMLTGVGMAYRLTVVGDWTTLLAWCVGAVFVPSLALAAGTWSRSGKLFEVIFMILVYLGGLERVAVFDFMGTTKESVATGMYWIYLVATIALLAVAVLGRRQQLQQ